MCTGPVRWNACPTPWPRTRKCALNALLPGQFESQNRAQARLWRPSPSLSRERPGTAAPASAWTTLRKRSWPDKTFSRYAWDRAHGTIVVLYLPAPAPSRCARLSEEWWTSLELQGSAARPGLGGCNWLHWVQLPAVLATVTPSRVARAPPGPRPRGARAPSCAFDTRVGQRTRRGPSCELEPAGRRRGWEARSARHAAGAYERGSDWLHIILPHWMGCGAR